ncbi:hypothetical protein FRC00_013664 [Tulasnella sp. 408]|nr:hypothetical protein FRC00_013664 [Tulasnella sp. 408]
MRRGYNTYTDIKSPIIAQDRTKKSTTTKSPTKPHPAPEPSAIAVVQKKRKRSSDNVTTQESDVCVLSAKKLKPDDASKLDSNSCSERLTNTTNLSSNLATTSTSKGIPPEHVQNESVSLDIDHGYFQSMGDDSKIIRLTMDASGFERQFQVVGQDSRKRCVVRPSDLGIVLELIDDDQGPLVRQVLVLKVKSVTSVETTIRVGGIKFPLGDKPVILLPGSLIKFGGGPWFRYHGPQYQNLYRPLDPPLHDELNSSVSRIRRLHDGFVFVVKTISKNRSRMAQTELAVYKELGRHPSILRAVESFFNKTTEIYNIVLEAASKDLQNFVDQTRQNDQAGLRIAAPAWTESVVAGVAHIHACGIAHRDLKPKNVLVFITEDGYVSLKVTDFGLARLSTEGVIKNVRHCQNFETFESTTDAPNGSGALERKVGGRPRLSGIITMTATPIAMELEEFCTSSSPRSDGHPKAPTLAEDVDVTNRARARIRLLRDVLVGFPDQCMSIEEMRERSYLKSVSSGGRE